jgi:hypothetical protein
LYFFVRPGTVSWPWLWRLVFGVDWCVECFDTLSTQNCPLVCASVAFGFSFVVVLLAFPFGSFMYFWWTCLHVSMMGSMIIFFFYVDLLNVVNPRNLMNFERYLVTWV